MIKHVSLALNLRDGFRGRPIGSGAGLSFTLDGQDIRPIFKDDGWCVFIDLPGGDYALELNSRWYAPRKWNLCVDDPKTFYLEEYVTLEPTRSYPFGRMVRQADVAFFHMGRPLADQALYLVSDRAESPLKLAQDGVKGGFTALKLFSPRKPELLALPDRFLVDDGAKSEIVTLSHAGADGEFTVGAPLRHAHARGVAFKRVREYRTGADGAIFLAFTEADGFTAYWESPKGFVSASAALGGAVEGRLAVDFGKGV